MILIKRIGISFPVACVATGPFCSVSFNTTALHKSELAKLYHNGVCVLKDDVVAGDALLLQHKEDVDKGVGVGINADVPVGNVPIPESPVVEDKDQIIKDLKSQLADRDSEIKRRVDQLDKINSDFIDPEGKVDAHKAEEALKIEADREARRKHAIDMVNEQFDREKDMGSNEFLSDLIPTTFPLISESKDMMRDAESTYQERAKLNGKNSYPDTSLGHLRDQENALYTYPNKDMYCIWETSKDLYKLWIRSMVKAISAGKPVGSMYIKSFEGALMRGKGRENDPVFSINPSGTNTVAKVAYGLSHGAYDLVHFVESLYNEITVRVRFITKGGSPSHGIHIDVAGIKADGSRPDEFSSSCENLPFGVEGAVDMNTFMEDNTIVNRPYAKAVYDKLYEYVPHVNGDGEIEDTIKVGFNISGKVEKSAVTVRDYNNEPKSLKFVEGQSYKTSLTENLNIPIHSDPIMFQLVPLFLIGNSELNLTKLDRNDILTYIAASVHQYVKQHVKINSEAHLTHFDFKLTLKRRVLNKDLMTTFRSFVNSGSCVPLTPLHYQTYLGLNSDFKEWTPYIFFSSVFNPRLSEKFISLMPYMKGESRRIINGIARNHNRLNSSFYTPVNIAIPFQIKQMFGIDWEMFIREMFVRTVLDGPMPDYLHPISGGTWIIAGKQLVEITPANINKNFGKFTMNDHVDSVNVFVKSMLILDKPIPYLKDSVRLSNKLPEVYSIYVPSSEMPHPNTHSISRGDHILTPEDE